MKEEPLNLSRKPTETRFHQQRLHGWTPSFDAQFISRLFIGSSLVNLLIGSMTIIVSSGIVDFGFDYTNCQNVNGLTCAEIISNKSYTENFISCECQYSFTLEQRFKAPIYFYYMLGNFYQNHRKYVSSRDQKQLHGDDIKNLNIKCEPQRYEPKERLQYAPCGLIANSKFNDTFNLNYAFKNLTVPVFWTNNDISWNIDRNIKFGRPGHWNNTIKPENWMKSAIEYNMNSYSGDEEFLVWMRTAPFQNFKKLHRIIHSGNSPFESGLPEGNYTLVIKYAYPVTQYKGSKSVFFSTTSIFGGKSIILSLMFLLLSGVHFVLGTLLMYLDKFSDPSLAETRMSSVTKEV